MKRSHSPGEEDSSPRRRRFTGVPLSLLGRYAQNNGSSSASSTFQDTIHSSHTSSSQEANAYATNGTVDDNTAVTLAAGIEGINVPSSSTSRRIRLGGNFHTDNTFQSPETERNAGSIWPRIKLEPTDDTDMGVDENEGNNNDPTLQQNPAVKAEMTEAEISGLGVEVSDAVLKSLSTGVNDDDPPTVKSICLDLSVARRRRLMRSRKGRKVEPKKPQHDFFGSMAQYPELIMELAKHLRIPDLVSLYSISKEFHETLNGHLSHVMKYCAKYQAPESSRIFFFNLYGPLCMLDPVGRFRPNTTEIRKVPTLRWLQMVVHREKVVRDILACMAREGHRMPKTMSLSIKKMWLVMDIATSARRVQLMHNEEYWTDFDIYNIQLFMIKLEMRFNDPTSSSADDGLKKLMLGQRGLTPLRNLLKRTAFTDAIELIQCAVRYAYKPRPQHLQYPIFGVPPNEVGRGHLEGWGKGKIHLYRLDELILREACRRNLELDKHMMSMLLWGYVDPVTKQNIAVRDEEMYMSEDDHDQKDLKKEEGVRNDIKGKAVHFGDFSSDDDNSDGDGGEMDLDGDGWETDDEDMAEESMEDDVRDQGNIGPSGFRRERSDSADDV